MADFTVVIPVKGTAAAKTRLGPGDNSELAKAMALDTVEAALKVVPVVVVTGAEYAAEFAELGATVIPDPGLGLDAAILAGLATITGDSAVLLGDLPGMPGHELGAALEAAASYPRTIVPDADGDGTVLLTALAGHDHVLAFGEGSRARHIAAGYTELIGEWPGLRRDVDLPEHLLELPNLGQRTRLALER